MTNTSETYEARVTSAYAPHVALPGELGEVAKMARDTAIAYEREVAAHHHFGAASLLRRYERLTARLGVDPLA